jgi:hypothetical protein
VVWQLFGPCRQLQSIRMTQHRLGYSRRDLDAIA